jgi:predicted metal-dependent peptidase
MNKLKDIPAAVKEKAAHVLMSSKIRLQKPLPMFSYILGYCRIKEYECNTCCIDRYANIGYNPEWIASLPHEEVQGVLVHELMHYYLQHHLRMPCNAINNIAMDIVNNNVLVRMKDIRLPKIGIIPENNQVNIYGYLVEDISSKTAEQIAAELRKHVKEEIQKHCKEKGEDGGESMPGMDEHLFDDEDVIGEKKIAGKDMKSSEEMQKKWEEIAARATTIAKLQGSIPAGMEHLIKDLLVPKVHWKEKLRRFIRNQIVSHKTYDRPSKRGISMGVYLPKPLKENIDLLIHIDSSGSVLDKASEFLSEVYAIMHSHHNVRVDLLVSDSCDPVHIQLTRKEKADIKGLKIPGGGGTSHEPVVRWIREKRPSCSAAIFFTDGYSDIANCFPQLPVSCKRIGVFPDYCQSSKDELNRFFSEIILLEEGK